MLREYLTPDFFTSLILVCLLLVVIVRQLFSNRFSDFLAIIYNDRYLKLYSREKKRLDIFSLLLFINFILATATFVFLSLKDLKTLSLNIYSALPILIVALSLIIILKSLLERIVGHFFEFSDVIKTYLFQKNAFKYISGLLLVLANVLILYSHFDKKIIIYITFGLLFLINLNGFIRFLKLYQKNIINNFFYFLLYLCALEIGPYVILYKVFKDYFG